MLCCYGCGNEGKYLSKTTKEYKCAPYHTMCPAIKNKTRHVAWNKGQVGTFKGKSHKEITKQKISERMKGNKNANHRGDRQSYYKDIRMDSRWEVGVAHYLDTQNLVWKYNEYGIKLSDGRYYYPDFFIYENNTLIKIIEVKGYFRENNQKKYQQVLSEHPHLPIELWQRDKLYSLGIINREGYTLG